MGTAIVAIPSKDDYVWNISSEKVPHLTLLYLGETTPEQNQKIGEYLEHVAKVALRRFGLSVDKRGELGSDSADVLFFEKERWFMDEIETARGYMLKDNTISAAYNSVEQFPEWIPHLTLGYPDNPAKPDTRDYPGIHHISFDRIGLWTGDSVGYEFELDSSRDLESVAYGEIGAAATDAALAHFGVKGMKWGVRRSVEQLRNGPVREAQPVIAKTKAGSSKVSTSGGKGHPASDDVLKVAAAKQKLTASGMNALSNAELKAITDRMNMEQKFASAIASLPPKHPGRDMVKKMIKEQGKSELQSLIKGDTGKWTKKMLDLTSETEGKRKARRKTVGEKISEVGIAGTVALGVRGAKLALNTKGGKRRK